MRKAFIDRASNADALETNPMLPQQVGVLLMTWRLTLLLTASIGAFVQFDGGVCLVQESGHDFRIAAAPACLPQEDAPLQLVYVGHAGCCRLVCNFAFQPCCLYSAMLPQMNASAVFILRTNIHTKESCLQQGLICQQAHASQAIANGKPQSNGQNSMGKSKGKSKGVRRARIRARQREKTAVLPASSLQHLWLPRPHSSSKRSNRERLECQSTHEMQRVQTFGSYFRLLQHIRSLLS